VPRFVPVLLLSLLPALLPADATAQDTSPSVTVVLSAPAELLADLKFLLDLAPEKERAQWENVKEVLETFLFGIDPTKPIGVEVLLGGEVEQFRFILPISDFTEFREDNLGGFEIESIKVANGLYRLRDADQQTIGYMRYANGYAVIGEKRADVQKAPPAVKTLSRLVARKFDIAVELRNKPAGQAGRRQTFSKTRDNLLAALKQAEDESLEDLQVRRQLLGVQLDEAERFFVESGELLLGLTIDRREGQIAFDLDLAAIPATSLAGSIEKLATTPSHFAAVKPPADSILSSRINHPLDDFRREGLGGVVAMVGPAAKARIDRRVAGTPAQKNAEKQFVDLALAVVSDTVKDGLLDGFVDLRPVTGGKHVLVAGLRTSRGGRLRDALALLPMTTLKQPVKLDVATVGDVAIHSTGIPEEYRADFELLFGPEAILYVGTSDKAVWCAAGPGAREALEASIKAVASSEPAPARPEFFDLMVQFGPWFQLLDRRGAEAGESALGKLILEDLFDPEIRKLAIESFKQGQDKLHLQMKRNDDRIVGRAILGTGVLRFLGRLIAKFSEENLE